MPCTRISRSPLSPGFRRLDEGGTVMMRGLAGAPLYGKWRLCCVVSGGVLSVEVNYCYRIDNTCCIEIAIYLYLLII
jgi:hypothetical protein